MASQRATTKGGETDFTLDVTGSIRPGQQNTVAVRVLNPSNTPMDGVNLGEIPHSNNEQGYHSGSGFNSGGLIKSVELLLTPAVLIEGIHLLPDWKTGTVQVEAKVRNTLSRPVSAEMEVSAAPANNGQTVAALQPDQAVPGRQFRRDHKHSDRRP